MARWINWTPTPGEEAAQNVRQILKTEPGTVPLARTLGMSQNAVDTPMAAAGKRLQADAVRAVRTWEPRVKVKSVRLVPNADGLLEAVAEIVEP